MSKPTLDDYRREALNVRDAAQRMLDMLDAVETAVQTEGARLTQEAVDGVKPKAVIDGRMVAEDRCDHPKEKRDRISGFGASTVTRCRDCGKEWKESAA